MPACDAVSESCSLSEKSLQKTKENGICVQNSQKENLKNIASFVFKYAVLPTGIDRAKCHSGGHLDRIEQY